MGYPAKVHESESMSRSKFVAQVTNAGMELQGGMPEASVEILSYECIEGEEKCVAFTLTLADLGDNTLYQSSDTYFITKEDGEWRISPDPRQRAEFDKFIDEYGGAILRDAQLIQLFDEMTQTSRSSDSR